MAQPKVLLAENIPGIAEWLQQWCEVSVFSQRQPTPAQLAEADALLIRSITQVDDALVKQAPKLRFVGTATIGVEHVDVECLKSRGIAFSNAAGGNAEAVGEYVLSAFLLDALAQGHDWQTIAELDVAIVGAGHTGKAAGRRLAALGCEVNYYDPPLLKTGQQGVHDHWQRVLNADVISCHVPLTRGGEHPTHHLFDAEALQSLHQRCLLINASRGAVVSATALQERLQQPDSPRIMLDVFEHEPDLRAVPIAKLALATPHIAGHSLEGKAGGAVLVANQLAALFNYPHRLTVDAILPDVSRAAMDITAVNSVTGLASCVHGIYDIKQDDQLLRSGSTDGERFDQLRREYRRQQPRRQLSTQTVICGNQQQQQWLSQLGFSTQLVEK